MTRATPVIAVFGASGLIGHALAEGLRREGFGVRAIARRFTPAQSATFADDKVEAAFAEDPAGVARLLVDADIVLNCVGVLQDGPRGRIRDVHRGFVSRLLEATAMRSTPPLLIHLSIPGDEQDDRTAFSRTKREAEHLILAANLPFAILRPGFVIAPAAYGGSALIRALAALPVHLPVDAAQASFQPVAVADIVQSVGVLARRWRAGDRDIRVTWDLMAPQPSTVASVVEAFRLRFGGPKPAIATPSWFLDAGAHVGDLAGLLGWSPPIRTTALREMRRGVAGDPTPWMAATGIEPTRLDDAMVALPATIQERWFSRLFLTKPVIVGCLALFWIVSGGIALRSFDAAAHILVVHGFSRRFAEAVTLVSSLADVAVGAAIAYRRTCAHGLLAGITLSLFYMASAALITPEMWLEPLGALVKTAPAIVLMGVAWLILDDR